jgi:hypothetical protein
MSRKKVPRIFRGNRVVPRVFENPVPQQDGIFVFIGVEGLKFFQMESGSWIIGSSPIMTIVI